MYLARFSYDLLPVDRERAIELIHGEIEAARRDGLQAIGRLQGKLRGHHLRYHLVMRELLDIRQLQAYQHMRGYTDSEQPAAHGGHRATRAGDATSLP